MEYAHKLSKFLQTKTHLPSISSQYLPSDEEYLDGGLYDPIGDTKRWSAPQLVHRYKNRALFLPTLTCPVNCRFCFRKNLINERDYLFHSDFEKTLDYLRAHAEIEEIIFTGGDPFILSAKKLKEYLDAFEQIEHLKFLRFHTRTPLAEPSLITNDLVETIESTRFKTNVMIHINHSDELFPEVREALGKFRVPLYSQTVLLKGVNDSAEVLTELFKNLVNINIQPYYLHHPDQVKGAMHFYLSEKEGYEIYQTLKQEISGWMLPKYVVDNPQATGKQAVLPS